MSEEKDYVSIVPDLKEGQTIHWNVNQDSAKATRQGKILKTNGDDDMVLIEYERRYSKIVEGELEEAAKTVATWVSGKNLSEKSDQ